MQMQFPSEHYTDGHYLAYVQWLWVAVGGKRLGVNELTGSSRPIRLGIAGDARLVYAYRA